MSAFYTQQHPRFSICTLSLGTNLYHSLPTKTRVASELGYEGIELFTVDFEVFVQEVRDGKHHELFPESSFTPSDFSTVELERRCAVVVNSLCKRYGLEIPILQPFRNFENFYSDEEIDAAVDTAARWFDLMPYMGTDLLLICSNFIESGNPITSGRTTMEAYLDMQVRAFRRLGERAAKYGVRVGYEPLAWGTVVENWQQVWKVVSTVDMPNVGIILDSFNSLGNQYADPTMPDSLRPAPLSVLLDNLYLLSKTIPGHKIFFYQIGDAHRPRRPVLESPDAPARMTWSRASRLFPLEKIQDPFGEDAWRYTGFLPVVEMTRAIHATGYNGWWSLEVFNASLMEADGGCPWRHGKRGIDGLHRLWAATCDDEDTESIGTPTLVPASVAAESDSELESSSEVSVLLKKGINLKKVNERLSAFQPQNNFLGLSAFLSLMTGIGSFIMYFSYSS
ncbi:hypothetical protein AMATHDRAFT_58735 [Amanita thiersii Skay4041]|uniref:Xylose isomerase-like TIM barrel domain-containing protein n=1 Tax=Amanita thiersii Skay4041 TaxID=703135 RepID=A0A2A9NVD1_9AGAR|nr:hypothetical protein AMATHDRAFT_58735 [Amanita thiersii Skay4041]